MLRFARKTSPLLSVAIGALVLAVFAADLLTPRGITVWVFYLAPLVLSLYGGRSSTPLLLAALMTALLLVDYLITPLGELPMWFTQVNRVCGVITVWSVAIVTRQFVVSRLALQRQDWLQRGHAQLGEHIRGEQTPAELGANVLRFLSGYLDASIGALYAADGEDFERLATWATASDASPPKRLRRGEGITGQAAAEGKVVVLHDLPDDYAKVASTLGAARPRHVLVAPITAEGRLNGVIEIGFLAPVGEVERELVARIAEAVGMALRAALYRERLEQLLEETQRQAEELQSQQEELRVTNEELEQQSRILKEAHGRLENQQAELEQTNTQLEEQAASLERQKDALVAAQQALTANAEALTQVSRYKSEFLANMSHELRTPLNSALILARLLAENRGGNLTAEQVRYAETIYSAGDDLLALINDILDLSKIEAGRVEVHVEALPLERVLEPLRRTFAPIAGDKKLAFRITVDPAAPKVVTTDGQRLQQILKNLLSNAFKFTDAGEVALTVGPGEGGRVAFAVKDSGVGIPAHQHAIIFEAFRQADGTTNRKYGGTGLGLSISRELARLLGGDITVTSAPGQGSTFHLAIAATLDPASRPASARAPAAPEPRAVRPLAPLWAKTPRASDALDASHAPSTLDATNAANAANALDGSNAASAPSAAPRPAAAEPGLRRPANARRILVIEDDPNFARILHDLAHELAFECLIAGTADEGLALARTRAPSAVLLDVGLPDGSGLGVLERLKRDPATRPIPVHVISAADYTQTALELGAVGFALKPVKRDELAHAIEKLAERAARELRRVLVVEDDPRQRESIAALLQASNVEIVGVGTAREALVELARATFDCMVLDLTLPDASGYELLEEMAAGAQYAFPPVIVNTGRDLDRDEEQRLRRYSKSIIVKGAKSPERLLDEVTLFLHQVEANLPPEQQRLLEQVRSRESVFEGRKILLVEDDVRNIFALSSVLEPRGATMLVARNGREALDALDRSPNVDLVLMDIMMPEMDGLTATREIRKQKALEKLPIIALTAKAMPDDRAQCLAAGANDYIPKPLDIDKLVSLCRVWMAR